MNNTAPPATVFPLSIEEARRIARAPFPRIRYVLPVRRWAGCLITDDGEHRTGLRDLKYLEGYWRTAAGAGEIHGERA